MSDPLDLPSTPLPLELDGHPVAADSLLQESAEQVTTRALDRLRLTAQQKPLPHPPAETGGLGRIGSRSTINPDDLVSVLCMASETHDANSSNHLKRIASYTGAVARELGWPGHRVAALATASKLHDVGKIGVPDSILKKPDTLTLEERRTMQQHTRFGYQILQTSSVEVMRMGALIALRHHERYDGKGYPDALGETAIPLEARVVSVADVFDALTSARPYKPAWSNQAAIQFLEDNSGKMFDPQIVAAFLNARGEIEASQRRFLDDLRDLWVERREGPRLPVEAIGLGIDIAMPEQTFQPRRFEAELVNVSQGGLKLKVTGLTHHLFTMLVTSRRYAKLHCAVPGWQELQETFSAVVWMDYYAVPEPDSCLMGLQFQKSSPRWRTLIEDLLHCHPDPLTASTPAMA